MIRKIISLNNVGRFEALKAHGDVEFRKFTLVFADNGVGKTTLCEVIRSLQTGNPDILAGRKTLGARGDPEAKILLADGTVAEFKGGGWSRTPPGGVSIFDATYVRDNVHAGEVVDTSHRRNLFQVIVGAEGVKLARLVEALERQRSELNAPIRDAKKAIEAAVPAGMSLDTFLNAEADPDINGKIALAESELAAARKADAIRSHRPLQPVALPSLPTTFIPALETSVEDVAVDAEETLRRHVAHLGGRGAESWLATGTTLVKDDACPFCAGPVAGNTLVTAYRSCFSDAYKTLSGNVASLDGVLRSALGEVARSRIQATVAGNLEASAWWKDYVALTDAPAVDLDALGTAMADLLENASELVREKRDNLMATVTPGVAFRAASGALEASVAAVNAYNLYVADQNEIIAACKVRMAGADATHAEARLSKLQALRRRHEGALSERCSEYLELMERREALGSAKDAAKSTLDEHTARVMGTYETELNRLLGKFMSGFQVRRTRAEFPKGLPSSSYRLVINDVEIEVGNEQSPESVPTFRNTLSGGDRSALALALFMAQLSHAENRSEIAVLLDDPFQSQDAFRRTATAFQVKRAGDNARQVVVMSHDPHFLKLIWDELPFDERKALRLHTVGRTSTMSEWDIYEHLKSDHQRNIAAMQRYLDDGRGEPRDVAQKLRLALEGYCKLVAYGEFGEKDMMGDIISAVRDAGPSHVLHGVLDQLEEYNSYARQYHHATNVDAATEPFNEGELQSYTRRILALMRVRAVAA